MNWKPKQIYFDVSLAMAYAQILCSEDLSQPVWELRFMGLRRLQAQLTHYKSLGYDPSLLEAISEKKSQMVLQVSSQTELDRVIRPHAPRFDGNKLIPDHYSVPEEELICWCETSLRAPLNEYGQQRYMEVFRQVFPGDSKVPNLRECL